MTQRLKRWESPRREGRNHKGKGGSARQRQKRKQFQALRKRLKDQSNNQHQQKGGDFASLLFWHGFMTRVPNFGCKMRDRFAAKIDDFDSNL